MYRIIELLTLPGKHGTQPALPRTTSLLSLAFALPLITIDLSGDIQKSLVNSGATDEMLTVACLTNSLLANFTQFNSLQILLDGKRCNTLAGHIDISRPLGYQTGY
ncbi:GerMN domain-containing protein [bacterium]|nr:GerMN domain-containing protein [bacterium]